MGSIYGVGLATGGIGTVLIDVAEPLVAKLRGEGVTVVRGKTERTVPVSATNNPAEVGPVDVALFFVKGYHTEAAARFAEPLVGPGTTVASLQNGWGNGDVLAAAFGPDRLVIGVTYHSGTGAGLGRVNHTNLTDAPTFVGPWTEAGAYRAGTLAALLRAGGFAAEVAADVRSEIWRKVTLNAAALPTSALTGYTAGALAADARMMWLVDELAGEAVAVGLAAGFDIDLHERLEKIHAALPAAGTGKASMLQDVEAGRRTEIATINGAVVRLGAAHGLAVPMNRAMVALVEGYERARGLV
jgi:2-dehydropantoate 2-reductase